MHKRGIGGSSLVAEPAVFGLLSFICCHVGWAMVFSGGATYEFCHYAEIARNLLEGRGLVTRVFLPGELAALEAAGRAAPAFAPALSRYPLFAVWSAVWLRIGGGGDYGMALGGIMAAALWTATVRVVLGRFFGAATGRAAATLWAAAPIVAAGYAVNGYAEPLYGSILLLLLGGLAQMRDLGADVSRRRALILGLAGGLAQGTHGSFFLTLPVLACTPLPAGLSRREFIARLSVGWLGFCLLWTSWLRLRAGVMPPVLLWNLLDGGATPHLPGLDYTVHSWGELMPLTTLAAKAWGQFNRTLSDLPGLWDLEILFPAAVLGVARTNGPARRLVALAGALFVWELTAYSFLTYENLVFLGHRYLIWASPLLVGIACGSLLEGWRRGGRWRLVCGAVFALQAQQMAWLWASRVAEARADRRAPIESLPELEAVQQLVPAQATVLTNLPTQVGWYADRRSVNIPHDPSDVVMLRRREGATYLLWSLDAVGEPGRYPGWLRLMAGAGGPPNDALRRLGFHLVWRSASAVLAGP